MQVVIIFNSRKPCNYKLTFLNCLLQVFREFDKIFKLVVKVLESKLKMADKRVEVKKIKKSCPHDQYVEMKLQKQRLLELEKRKVEVSKITAKDKKTFEKAHKILCGQRVKPIKRVKSSKSLKSLKSREGINMCPMFCKKANTVHELRKHEKLNTANNKIKKGTRCQTASKKEKPVIVIPPLKTKPWVPPKVSVKVNQKAVIVIPPVKTKPWVPESRAKPKFHPVIEKPPLTFRKS